MRRLKTKLAEEGASGVVTGRDGRKTEVVAQEIRAATSLAMKRSCRMDVVLGWFAFAMAVCFSQFAFAEDAAPFPKIHQVAGGPSEVFANSYIIEGKSGVVVIDALLTRSGSRNLRQQVEAIGRSLLAVVLTHGHPDHYGGVTQIVEGRPEIPVVAVNGVDAIIRRDDAMKGERLKKFGIDWAEKRSFPNVRIDGGVRLTFGDIALTPVDLGEGESHHDSIWILGVADGDYAFVGDLVMNGVHAYTADGHTGSWLASLRAQKTKLRNAARIYPGHGAPGGLELFKAQESYLEKFRSAVRELSAGTPSLSDNQIQELQKRMIQFLGHDKMSRWILEGANPVAKELADAAKP